MALLSYSASPLASSGLANQLKPNTVVVLSSLAVDGEESKLYALCCLAGGFWGLQMQSGLHAVDPAVHLVVVKQNGNLGFRSALAEGRLLCCNSQYHLAFENWRMESQEVWTLQGYSLTDCTLRNQKYKLSLNISVMVVAEPTDALGNTRITSALLTRPSHVQEYPLAHYKSANSTSAQDRLGQIGVYPSTLLVKTGAPTGSPCHTLPTDHTERLAHKDEDYNAFLLVNSGIHFGPPGPTPIQYQNAMIQGSGPDVAVPVVQLDNYTKGIATHYKQSGMLGDGAGHPPVQVMSCFCSRSTKDSSVHSKERSAQRIEAYSIPSSMRSGLDDLDFQVQELGSQMNDTHLSSPGRAKQARKWKRHAEVSDKLCRMANVDAKSSVWRQKRAHQQEILHDIVEEREVVPDSSQRGSSVAAVQFTAWNVVRRQSGCRAVNSDSSMVLQAASSTLEGKSSWIRKPRLQQSEILEAETNKDSSARKERERIVHSKLQATVQLLMYLTKQKMASATKEHPVAVSAMVKNQSSWIPLFLKSWLCLPVPLVALAVILRINRRKSFGRKVMLRT